MQWFGKIIPLLLHDNTSSTSYPSNGPIITLNSNSKWDCAFIYWSYEKVTYYTTSLLHHDFRIQYWDVCVSHPNLKDSVVIPSTYHSISARIELISRVCLLIPRTHTISTSISAANSTALLQTLITVLQYALHYVTATPLTAVIHLFFPWASSLSIHTVKASAEVDSRRWGSYLELNQKVQSIYKGIQRRRKH